MAGGPRVRRRGGRRARGERQADASARSDLALSRRAHAPGRDDDGEPLRGARRPAAHPCGDQSRIRGGRRRATPPRADAARPHRARERADGLPRPAGAGHPGTSGVAPRAGRRSTPRVSLHDGCAHVLRSRSPTSRSGSSSRSAATSFAWRWQLATSSTTSSGRTGRRADGRACFLADLRAALAR